MASLSLSTVFNVKRLDDDAPLDLHIGLDHITVTASGSTAPLERVDFMDLYQWGTASAAFALQVIAPENAVLVFATFESETIAAKLLERVRQFCKINGLAIGADGAGPASARVSSRAHQVAPVDTTDSGAGVLSPKSSRSAWEMERPSESPDTVESPVRPAGIPPPRRPPGMPPSVADGSPSAVSPGIVYGSPSGSAAPGEAAVPPAAGAGGRPRMLPPVKPRKSDHATATPPGTVVVPADLPSSSPPPPSLPHLPSMAWTSSPVQQGDDGDGDDDDDDEPAFPVASGDDLMDMVKPSTAVLV